MKKNSKVLQSLFYDYGMIEHLDEKGKEQSQWDEIVVNNFVVNKVHVTPDFMKMMKLLWISQMI